MHPAMARQFTADHIRDLTTEAGDSRRARGGAPRPAAPAACSPEAVYPAVRAAARVPPRTLDPGRAGCGRPGGELPAVRTIKAAGATLWFRKLSPPEARMPDIRAPKNQTPEPAGSGWRRGPLFAYLAALAATPVHLYWAPGGTWGLPGGAATADLPGIHATNLPSRSCWRAGPLFLIGLTVAARCDRAELRVRPRLRRQASHLRGVLRRPAGCARPGTHSRFSSRARATASVRFAAPSLPRTWPTCFLTVLRVTTSSPAMA